MKLTEIAEKSKHFQIKMLKFHDRPRSYISKRKHK